MRFVEVPNAHGGQYVGEGCGKTSTRGPRLVGCDPMARLAVGLDLEDAEVAVGHELDFCADKIVRVGLISLLPPEVDGELEIVSHGRDVDDRTWNARLVFGEVGVGEAASDRHAQNVGCECVCHCDLDSALWAAVVEATRWPSGHEVVVVNLALSSPCHAGIAWCRSGLVAILCKQ